MKIELRNRKEAYESIKPKCDKRKEVILGVLAAGNPDGMTAEEIVQQLYVEKKIPEPDMNYVRPRLTEMKKSGKVKVVDRRVSSRTQRHTSVWKITKL